MAEAVWTPVALTIAAVTAVAGGLGLVTAAKNGRKAIGSARVPVVVVIGGAFAGIATIGRLKQLLGARVKVVLVEEREGFFLAVHSKDAILHPEKMGGLWLGFSLFWSAGPDEVVRGRAARLGEGSVELEDGREVAFDYAVVATGTWSPPPGKVLATTRAEAVEEAQGLYGALATARDIVVVGGGQVGVELAAELATRLTRARGSSGGDVRVTLVHRGERLLSGMVGVNDEFRKRVQQELEAIPNVRVLVGQRVEGLVLGEEAGARNGWSAGGRRVLRTSAGEEVEADVVFLTTGNRANSEAVRDGAGGAAAVDGFGHVVTDASGRVVGSGSGGDGYGGRVFAAGDVAGLDEVKLASRAYQQGRLVAGNIAQLIRAEEAAAAASAASEQDSKAPLLEPKLAEYKAAPQRMRKVELGGRGRVLYAFGYVVKL
ncbi:hypothetical protein HK405_012160 [Cladochytrium tenue]|nr:hypothetical protein HK405_012160 [Cladochytrium tenue]